MALPIRSSCPAINKQLSSVTSTRQITSEGVATEAKAAGARLEHWVYYEKGPNDDITSFGPCLFYLLLIFIDIIIFVNDGTRW